MPKKNILVVDDEASCCELLRVFLADRGHSVDVARGGFEAQEHLSRNKYDVVFFDCNMPGMTGVELAKIILKTNPSAKKVMISGYEDINADFAKSIGVDIFLAKPIQMREIERIVNDGSK